MKRFSNLKSYELVDIQNTIQDIYHLKKNNYISDLHEDEIEELQYYKKLFEKKGKAGTYARLEDKMNPLQADFDKYINQPSTAKQSLKPLPNTLAAAISNSGPI